MLILLLIVSRLFLWPMQSCYPIQMLGKITKSCSLGYLDYTELLKFWDPPPSYHPPHDNRMGRMTHSMKIARKMARQY